MCSLYRTYRRYRSRWNARSLNDIRSPHAVFLVQQLYYTSWRKKDRFERSNRSRWHRLVSLSVPSARFQVRETRCDKSTFTRGPISLGRSSRDLWRRVTSRIVTRRFMNRANPKERKRDRFVSLRPNAPAYVPTKWTDSFYRYKKILSFDSLVFLQLYKLSSR